MRSLPLFFASYMSASARWMGLTRLFCSTSSESHAVATPPDQKLRRGLISQRGVRSLVVIPKPICLGKNSCPRQAPEILLLHKFVPKPAVERLRERVLPRARRGGAHQGYTRFPRPAGHLVRYELRPVIGADEQRPAVDGHQPGEDGHHRHGWEPRRHLQRHAKPGVLVHDAQEPQGAAVPGLVLEEVQAPEVVLVPRPQPPCDCRRSPPSGTPRAQGHLQLHGLPEPLDGLPAHLLDLQNLPVYPEPRTGEVSPPAGPGRSSGPGPGQCGPCRHEPRAEDRRNDGPDFPSDLRMCPCRHCRPILAPLALRAPACGPASSPSESASGAVPSVSGGPLRPA
jgi:hypothetical protein